MPVPTVLQLTQKEAALKQSIAGKGKSLEPAKRRGLAKRLRRLQRKRRRLTAQAIRTAPKATAAPAEGAK